MSDIRNERDLVLQHAEARIIEVVDPGAIIIPGFTGIVLSKDPSLFVISFGAFAVNPVRMVLTAQLRGIPPGATVSWTQTGNLILTPSGDPLVQTIEASNYPRTSPLVMPDGSVTVSVSFGGQTFTDTQRVLTFTG